MKLNEKQIMQDQYISSAKIPPIENFAKLRKYKGESKPTPQHLTSLKQQGYTQKDIATVYGVSERMVRYWKKDDDEPKKVGRKEKLNQKYLSYLRLYVNSSRTKNQKEVAKYFSELMGKKVSQPTICRAIRK